MKIIIKFTIFILIFTNTFLYKIYSKDIIIKKGIVISDKLNITCGTTINHNTINVAYKNDILNIIGEIDDWYIIQFEDKTIGAAIKNNIQILENDFYNTFTEKIIDNINEIRIKNNIKPFEKDINLNNIALKKAIDIIENKYISHKSPTYDTPFKMLKNMGVKYDFLLENIIVVKEHEDIEYKIINNKLNNYTLLNENFTKLGIGIIENENKNIIIIEIFLK